jgi:hypothetical protein
VIRTNTYKPHLKNTAKKTSACVNLIQKLAGMNWESDTQTLRTASLALVYSTAEYSGLLWLNSVHTRRVNIQLNNVMLLIFGTLKSTQLPWLMTRKAAVVRELVIFFIFLSD